MARTITVKGIGRASAKPDYVILSMTLESKHQEYETAMNLAADQIQHLNDTLCGIGFEKGSVKTTNFDVRTDYDRVKDRNGSQWWMPSLLTLHSQIRQESSHSMLSSS